MGKFVLALAAAACVLAACGCGTTMTEDQRRAKTAAALERFAAKLVDEGAMSDERIFQALEAQLGRNKFVFGAAYASAPDKTGPEESAKVLYVHREDGRLLRDFRPAYAFAKAATAAWYTAPLKSGKPEWAAPYFDVDGAGAQVKMTTYSLPVLKDGKLAFVVTSDLLLEEKEPADQPVAPRPPEK